MTQTNRTVYAFIEPTAYDLGVDAVVDLLDELLPSPWRYVWERDGQSVTFTRGGVVYGEPFVAFRFRDLVAHGEDLEEVFWEAFWPAQAAYVATPGRTDLNALDAVVRATAARVALEEAVSEQHYAMRAASRDGWYPWQVAAAAQMTDKRCRRVLKGEDEDEAA